MGARIGAPPAHRPCAMREYWAKTVLYNNMKPTLRRRIIAATRQHIPNPDAVAANPFVGWELRSIRWMETRARMQAFNRRVLALMVFGLSAPVLMLAGVLVWLSLPNIVPTVIIGAIGLSWLLAFFVDFLCVLYGASVVRKLPHHAMFDLLRTSSVDPQRIVTAQFELARAMAWRPVMTLLASRVAIVLWMLLYSVFAIIRLSIDYPTWAALATDPQTALQFLAIGVVYLGAVVSVSSLLLIDPLRRYKLMISLGMYFAATRKNVYEMGLHLGRGLLFTWLGLRVVPPVIMVVVGAIVFNLTTAILFSALSIVVRVPLVIFLAGLLGLSPVLTYWVLRTDFERSMWDEYLRPASKVLLQVKPTV